MRARNERKKLDAAGAREREMMVCWAFFSFGGPRRSIDWTWLVVMRLNLLWLLWRRIFCGKMWFKFFKNNFGYSEF